MFNKQAPIGVFDSGVGGLTVVKEILKQLPAESVIYFGDTAHVPYGHRSPEELLGFADSITRFLIAKGVKMIVVACNTSSSLSLNYLQRQFSLPIVGVIEPGIITAAQQTKNKKIGVIATEATIKSGVHKRIFGQIDPEIKVFAQACPAFVPLVEAGKLDTPETRQKAAEYLAPIVLGEADTLILGCTHYPYLIPVLRDILGPDVDLIDPAEKTVKLAAKVLEEQQLLALAPVAANQYEFYVSGDPDQFYRSGRMFLQIINQVSHVNLDDYARQGNLAQRG